MHPESSGRAKKSNPETVRRRVPETGGMSVEGVETSPTQETDRKGGPDKSRVGRK